MGAHHFYALTFVSADRPGIVADVSRVLFENGFNIADSSSTLLQGHFSMILVVSHDTIKSEQEIKEMFAGTGLTLNVSTVDDQEMNPAGDHYIISVYGSDKPGIVLSVATELAAMKINIIDLQTKVTGRKDKPVYIMVLEVVIPEGLTEESWAPRLKELSHKNGTDINVRQIETYEF